MNLRIFFDSINEFNEIHFETDALISIIDRNSGTFPSWQDASIAIIGIQEERGTLNIGFENGADNVRKKLYALNRGSSSKKIVDLGNLRKGITLKESQLRLKEVCEILLEHQIFPLIIGGGHGMDYGQFLGYENKGKLINVLYVDPSLDMFGSEEYGENKHHLHKLLVHEPPLLFHYALLGYQSYLTSPESIAILEKLHFETYRLGYLRERLEEMEPVVRNADMLSFDLSAIKKADAPGNIYAQPFGLTGEEACQLCWYAGQNPKLTSAGFYEYNPLLDHDDHTASVLAVMIWYLIEGFEQRRQNEKINEIEYTKYIVQLPQEPHKLTFYKDNRSERWWIEIPAMIDKPQYSNLQVLPCSYSDYIAANKGDIPIRWILTQAKMHVESQNR